MGEGREPSCRRGPGKALAWPLVLACHPARQHWSESRVCSSFPGSGGWAGLGQPLLTAQEEMTVRERICTRPRSAQRWPQEELPLREEGRRSAAHIRTCLFLPDAVERCPRHFVMAGRGLSFTLGQIPWRTLVCRAGHTLTGTQPSSPSPTCS